MVQESVFNLERECILALRASTLVRSDKSEVARLVAEGSSFDEVFRGIAQSGGENLTLPVVESILERCQRAVIEIVPLSSPSYPHLLKAASSPPLALFVRTTVSELQFPSNTIAVVGARSACVEVCNTTSRLAHDLVRAGCSVVSGLALGVDGAAHRGALSAGCASSTIAVMAHGLDLVYPRSHEFLARSIVDQGGFIVSEYPPGIQPLKHHFLERNRIVAGLARGIVVVQAGERSGSLVTANYAGDFGRDVFVLAGGDADERYRGSSRLCDEGALVVNSASEVLAEYGLGQEGGGGEWCTISLEELSELTGGSQKIALSWELEGRLVRISGNQFSIRS